MKPSIKIINKCKIQIAQWGKINQQTIDLTSYANQHVRIWLDKDGTYSLDASKNHFWQIAELNVPNILYQSVDTGEVDEAGEPVQGVETLPLDLTDVKIELFELPA